MPRAASEPIGVSANNEGVTMNAYVRPMPAITSTYNKWSREHTAVLVRDGKTYKATGRTIAEAVYNVEAKADKPRRRWFRR